MQFKFHKNSIKFLEKCSEKDKEKIRLKLCELRDFYLGIQLSNYHNLHIKNLDGEWKGFRRLRIGKIRIIYKIDYINAIIEIYEIDFRGDIYK